MINIEYFSEIEARVKSDILVSLMVEISLQGNGNVMKGSLGFVDWGCL